MSPLFKQRRGKRLVKVASFISLYTVNEYNPKFCFITLMESAKTQSLAKYFVLFPSANIIWNKTNLIATFKQDRHTCFK